MSSLLDLQRGQRMREIRMLRQETQEEFAEAINAASRRKDLGPFNLELTFNDVSKRETGTKSLDEADLVCIAYLDPKERSWFWLAWGDDFTIGKDAWTIVSGRRRAHGP